MYRIYPREWVIGKEPDKIIIDMKDKYFSNLLTLLFKKYKGDVFIVTDKFCTQIHNLKIDYTTGDIYYIVEVGKIEKYEGSEKKELDYRMRDYVDRNFKFIPKVSNVHVREHYIFKRGIKVENLTVYFPEFNRLVEYKLDQMLFENEVTSDTLIETFIVKELANKNTRISKIQAIRISKTFMELQDIIGSRVMKEGFVKKRDKKYIPRMETYEKYKYNEIPVDKNLAKLLFDLNLYSMIYNKLDITLHNGDSLQDQLRKDKYYFFKVKNDLYYLILNRKWFEWRDTISKGLLIKL